MLAEVLALFAAASGAPETATPPKTVSTVVVEAPAPPAIARNPDAIVNSAGGADDAIGDYVAVWPRGAYNAGKDGRVTLSCLIDIHGLAEWCKVAGETPPNQRFGRAALELRQTFRLKPAQGPDGPIAKVMTINVGFRAPDFQFDSRRFNEELRAIGKAGMGDRATIDIPYRENRLAMRSVTMVDDPVWASAASFDDLARAYPARGDGVEGYVAAHCQVTRSGPQAGALKYCAAIKEDPKGHDFGKAALSLTPMFRLMPEILARAPDGAPLYVDVPIRLPPPEPAAERTIKAPIWLLQVDPLAAVHVFPLEAVAQGLTSGRGVARCTVAADGTLTACTPETGEPDGLGFSEAAAKLASAMRMNLWSADGAPVAGGVVHIPIRLDLRRGVDGTAP